MSDWTPRRVAQGPSAFVAGLLLAAILVSRGGTSYGDVSPPSTHIAESRAVVVVDTGAVVHVEIVSFAAESISGLEALELAGAAPETLGYGGQGVAVCRLFGVGNPATQTSCLGTPADPRYWAYHRSPAGSSGYTYSSVGAGASRVRHGDVEGWKFGTGSAPPYYAFCAVVDCGGDSPASSTRGATRPGTVVASGGGADSAGELPASDRETRPSRQGASPHDVDSASTEYGEAEPIPGSGGEGAVSGTGGESRNSIGPGKSVGGSESANASGGKVPGSRPKGWAVASLISVILATAALFAAARRYGNRSGAE